MIAFTNGSPAPQLWLDLGCGTGLFTMALANYLPKGSHIIAIDINERSLKQLPSQVNGILIDTLKADFINDDLQVKDADGILMANSLHYVRDKELFLQKLIHFSKTNNLFLLVEYDRKSANQWVPFPMDMGAARDLFRNLGYSNFHILNKKPSVYGNDMYAALITK